MPYASVILPTFDRSSTLPISLLSIQTQSVRDIEILLLLDGSPQSCRDIAFGAAAEDSRIRVFDLPKAVGWGERNNAMALGEVRADRIFYNDDDDIWLPNHVATLGPLLDVADVAESRVVSVGRSGGLNLAPCPTRTPLLRKLFLDNSYNCLFDTHFAHTKASYDRFTSWAQIDPGVDKPVWRFINGFARNRDCKWSGTDAVTALSLHGGVRKDMSAVARAEESKRWQTIVADRSAFADEIAKAHSTTHLYRLMRVDLPCNESFRDYATRRGAYEDVATDPVNADLFDLMRGARAALRHPHDLVRRLTTLVVVGYAPGVKADILIRGLGAGRARQIVGNLSDTPGPHQAECLAIFATLLERANRLAAALKAIRTARRLGPDPRDHLRKIETRLAKKMWR